MQTLRAVLALSMFLASPVIVSNGNPSYAQEPTVTLVNVIPRALSGESHQDSEPNLAVNPANVNQLAASAFTSGVGFCGSGTAPIFISLNGGATWATSCIIPNDVGGMPGDITLRFTGIQGTLYAATLRNVGDLTLNILRTTDFTSPDPMAVLRSRENVDQPYIHATNADAKDIILVGSNDLNDSDAPGRTAVVDYSFKANETNPDFRTSRIEARPTSGQNGPPIRIAYHPAGVIYAAFYGWRSVDPQSTASSIITADVVVVREDASTEVEKRFAALKEPDGSVGMRVVKGVKVPWNPNSQTDFGNERFVGSNISIAVDPRPEMSNVVYLAWADRVGSNDYTVHVRRSINRGETWSSDLRTITNGTNPALAISNNGSIGFLYQRLVPAPNNQASRWETHLEITTSEAAFSDKQDIVLANVSANTPDPQFLPYIGDYIHLMAVGNDFYGVFSANNFPNKDNFHKNIVFQRNVNWETKSLLRLDNTTQVAPSIDPFFFKVQP